MVILKDWNTCSHTRSETHFRSVLYLSSLNFAICQFLPTSYVSPMTSQLTANKTFLQDMWTTASFQTTTHGTSQSSWTHLDERASWVWECDSLGLLWLTVERVAPSHPSREHSQLHFIGLPAIDGSGIVGIWSLLKIGQLIFCCTTWHLFTALYLLINVYFIYLFILLIYSFYLYFSDTVMSVG